MCAFFEDLEEKKLLKHKLGIEYRKTNSIEWIEESGQL